MLDDRDKWPTYEVVDGELLEISTRLRIHKQAAMASGTLSLTPPNDKESDDETAETVFVPETPPAETEDQ
jgi:hypothetical protein